MGPLLLNNILDIIQKSLLGTHTYMHVCLAAMEVCFGPCILVMTLGYEYIKTSKLMFIIIILRMHHIKPIQKTKIGSSPYVVYNHFPHHFLLQDSLLIVHFKCQNV